MAELRNAPRQKFRSLRSSLRALRLVWSVSRGLTSLLVAATLVSGIAPAAAAYVAKIAIDEVLHAAYGDLAARSTALTAIVVEALLMGAVVAANRALVFCQQLLKARLAHSVTKQILDKSVTLGLADFENPGLHDRLEEARREAPVRPLSLVMRSFTLTRCAIALTSYFALLIQLSWWAVAMLVVAGLPSFIAEARFSDQTFRFFQKHSPENRERRYVETLLTREEFAKEIGFFGLGPLLLSRYDSLFVGLYEEDRALAVRRHTWGLLLGMLGTAAFFGAYYWIATKTIAGTLTLGQMTMYLVVFRQGQTAVTSGLAALGGIYEDALYVDNLDAFLAHPATVTRGAATEGTDTTEGLRVEHLSWTYPGGQAPALDDVSFEVRPGETVAIVGHNGSGKSTLVKLLTRRYASEQGRILLEGRDLREWSDEGLRGRVSVLFQDFNRYKLTVGENLGAGDPTHFDDEEAWESAARRGLADRLIAKLPDGYHTRLGRAFRGAQELSGGNWQRVAFARALIQRSSRLLVFDEPTSAADPARQAELDQRLAEILDGRMGLIVSHRLATARIADRILVLDGGKLVESGSHDELVAVGGIYADLFAVQADAYQ